MNRTGGRVTLWALVGATGLSLVLLLLAAPARDECLLQPAELLSVSGIESDPLPPLGVRCRYLGPAGETVAVVDHRVPLRLVVAPALLAGATVVVAGRRRRARA